MPAKRKVEVFTARCPICEPAVEVINRLACQSCEVIIYDLQEGCITNECREKVNQYGITRLPAVAVNGNLLDCCKVGEITESELHQAGIGVA